MNPEMLQKLISLVERSGDKMVIADPVTGKSYVIMGLDAYEQLLGGVGQPAPVAQAVQQVPVQPQVQVQQPVPAPVAQPQMVAQSIPMPVQQVVQQPVAVSYGAQMAPQPAVAQQVNLATHTQESTYSAPQQGAPLQGLTQEELLDKINRDIGNWRSAQELNRTAELQSVAERHAPKTAEATFEEEEEQFYLEPIE